MVIKDFILRQKVNVALKMFNTQTAEAFSVLLERDDIRDTLNIIMNWFIGNYFDIIS